MKKWQRVNKFPGSGFVTNTVNLATSKVDPRIPKAFKIPDEVSYYTSTSITILVYYTILY